MIAFPNINPVILHIYGPFSITWYSLSYVSAILLARFYCLKLIKKFDLSINIMDFEKLITYAILGIIIGGRMGYVLFYDPIKYFNNLIEILKTYEGGMSFHGGLVGIAISIFLFTKIHKISFFLITDLFSSFAPFGLFLGRIANFINAELYGKVTTVSWAVIFPGSDLQPRHPSQIYEAFLEGFLLFIILNIAVFSFNTLKIRKFNTALFLLGYALARLISEIFREPDFYIFNFFTMGQILSLPMIIFSLYILYSLLIANKVKKCDDKKI